MKDRLRRWTDDLSSLPGINAVRSANFAFAIVVLGAYISATTALLQSHRSLPLWKVVSLFVIGGSYLLLEAFGFEICRRAKSQRLALVYFAIQLALAGNLIWLATSAGALVLILLPLAGQSALLLPPRWMIPICLLIYVNLVLLYLLQRRWVDAIEVALTWGTGIVFVVVFTQIAASERKARADLAEANSRLREHAAQVEELATTKERNRLAREIHDSIGHYLTVANVQLGAAQAICAQDQDRALTHLANAQRMTKEGLAEVRRSVAALRASPTDSRPLPEVLAKLVEQWDIGGTLAELEVDGDPRQLSPQADLTIYRAAQEALTNVGKHAQASHVLLKLDYKRVARVCLSVTDNGTGSRSPEGGFGLLGIRERAQLLGGDVRVHTEIGQGFSLEVELPV